jgi:hypothetical protein
MKTQNIITTVFFVLCLLLLAGFSYAGTWVENFDDGDYKNWKLMIGSMPYRAEVKVVDGELIFKHFGIAGLQWPDLLALEVSRDWSDYTIELRFKFGEADPNWGSDAQLMGVTYHDQFQGVPEGGPNCTWGCAHVSGDMHGVVSINGGMSVVAGGWHQFSRGTWYRRKFVVQETHYEIFIDDQKLFAYDWDGFTKGGIAIGAGNVVTYFDDIRIYGDSVPDGGASAVSANGKLTTTWAAMKKPRIKK